MKPDVADWPRYELKVATSFERTQPKPRAKTAKAAKPDKAKAGRAGKRAREAESDDDDDDGGASGETSEAPAKAQAKARAKAAAKLARSDEQDDSALPKMRTISVADGTKTHVYILGNTVYIAEH